MLDYNTRRPHQGIGMLTPAERFRVGQAAAAGLLPAVEADRAGADWVTRRVGANGQICVAWQQLSVGKHRAGTIVDVHLDGPLLQVWAGSELLKTLVRTDLREVRKKRAAVVR